MTAGPASSPETEAHLAVPDGSGRRRPWRLAVAVALLALLVMTLVQAFLVQSFYIPTGSMEPGLLPGDRIFVVKPGVVSDLRRGDIVVFDGSTAFPRDNSDGASALGSGTGAGIVGRVLGSTASLLSVETGESDYVKRVVGLPGDRVRCCEPDGSMTVNGTVLEEPYVFPGDAPSSLSFDVQVPEGRIWVMGDHRSQSADSRAHLGDPGGGMVRLTDVVGRAAMVYWPPARVARLENPIATDRAARAAR